MTGIAALSDFPQANERRPAARASAPLRFSFVIANYNYGHFVGRAIDSALAQDWPTIEVVVVDDGSTDDSAGVITAYGSRITAIFSANSGQRAANNTGFAASSGDVVVFLDADDILEPGFARAVAQCWRPGVSKIQVQMARVDAEERPLGSLVPSITVAPTAAQIRRWAMTTSEYPTPPGSGNAYARSFLDRFFPIGPEHDSFTDSTALALAPLLGDVETVLRPLVLYRQHGSNDSDLQAAPDRYGREVARAIKRQASAERICAALNMPMSDRDCLRRGRHLLQLRVASLRMAPEAHPPEAGGRLALFRDALGSLFPHGFEPLHRRVAVAGWAIAALFAPRPLAQKLIYWRFSIGR